MAEEKSAPTPPAPAKPASRPLGALGMVLPALLAAGGGFGGVKLAGKAAHAAPAAVSADHHVQGLPPGPTVALEPFLVTVADGNRKPRPMRMTIAIELRPGSKDEEAKPFVPRIRDTTLAFLRSLTYEEVSDAAKVEAARDELLTRLRRVGVIAADRVLITDLVLP